MPYLKLQSDPLSYHSTRVEIVLLEKKLPWESIPADICTKVHKTPEFLMASPFGCVPVLFLENNKPVYESRAIGRFLAYLYNGIGSHLLVQPGDEHYAEFEEALQIEVTKIDRAASDLINHSLVYPVTYKPADLGIIMKAKFDLQNSLNVIDVILAGRRYMAGNSFTLADINYIPTINMLLICQEHDLLLERPNLKRWWDEVSSRESSRIALQRLSEAWEHILEQTHAVQLANGETVGVAPDCTNIDAGQWPMSGFEHWPLGGDIWKTGDYYVEQPQELVKDGQ